MTWWPRRRRSTLSTAHNLSFWSRDAVVVPAVGVGHLGAEVGGARLPARDAGVSKRRAGLLPPEELALPRPLPAQDFSRLGALLVGQSPRRFSEVSSGVGKLLIGGAGEQEIGAHGILFDAEPLQIENAEIVLRRRVPPCGGLLVPLGRLGVILLDAFSHLVKQPEMVLRHHEAMVRGPDVPARGFGKVLVGSQPAFVHGADGVLGLGVVRFGERGEFLNSGCVVAQPEGGDSRFEVCGRRCGGRKPQNRAEQAERARSGRPDGRRLTVGCHDGQIMSDRAAARSNRRHTSFGRVNRPKSAENGDSGFCSLSATCPWRARGA